MRTDEIGRIEEHNMSLEGCPEEGGLFCGGTR